MDVGGVKRKYRIGVRPVLWDHVTLEEGEQIVGMVTTQDPRDMPKVWVATPVTEEQKLEDNERTIGRLEEAAKRLTELLNGSRK